MRVLAGFLLLLPLLAHADSAPLRPDDFAFGMKLGGDGEGALYAFDLPDEVYRNCVRADLGDMRVFNGSGEVVPSLLQHETVREEIRQTVALPIYPLYADEIDTKGETTLRIVPGQHGAVIDLRSQAAKQAGNRTISHYILDASALKQPIRRLTLHWQASNETFVSTVTVEASSDLSHWRSLSDGSLAELLYGNARLHRNEISLPTEQAPYLRINWPMGERVNLVAVEAEVAQPGTETEMKWSNAVSSKSDMASGRYDFDAIGHYPVERLQVVLPQDNTVVKVKLFSSNDPQSNLWTLRHQGVLYSLLHEGKRIETGEVSTAATNDRYWRLEVAQEGGGIGSGVPQLKLGWHPHRAVFAARGASPFILAFGSAHVIPSLQDQGLGVLLDTQRQDGAAALNIETVVPQTVYSLGGEQRLQPAPPPLPWKKWLLWTVLVAGVLAMLGMARGLYRQMNRA